MDTAYKTTLELDKVLNRAVQLCACQETKEMMQAQSCTARFRTLSSSSVVL